MDLIRDYIRELRRETTRHWNAFWFTPTDPATLAVIRIFTGAMLFYTHLVWLLDFEAFFGTDAWLNAETVAAIRTSDFAWSHFWIVQSPQLLWGLHFAALGVFACLALGLWTRPVSVLAYLIAVSYAHRVPMALFGLDQINCMLAMYLMIGPSGAAFSLDRWRLQRRSATPLLPAVPSVSANVSIRLMQVHLCILYLFAGVSKLKGAAWWDGTALWLAVANFEYQSIDMTWLVEWPMVINFLTHITILWEVSYCALVWPRLTRPLVILLAIPLHMGIALCLGMTTFGLIMLVANFSFVSPALVRRILGTRSKAEDTTIAIPAAPAPHLVRTRAASRRLS